MTSTPSPSDIAKAVASGMGSVAIEGGADGAHIYTNVQNNVRLELGADALEAVRALVPRELPRPRHNLREVDPAFRGRQEEEAALLAAIGQEPGSAAITALNGLGGIGKTALALRVAWKLLPIYPAAQLLIDLRGTSPAPVAPKQAMEELIHRFEPGAQLPGDADAVAEIYRDLLRRNRSILIFDNARDTAQVLPLLPPSPSAAIVTARGTLDLPNVTTRRLDCLPRDEAIGVLEAHLAGHSPDPGDLDRLAEACVDHPLSLHVAGSYLSKRWDYHDVSEFAAAVVANRGQLEIDGPDGKINVMAAIELSLRLLTERDAVLAEHWRDLAVFPADFDRSAAGAVWQTEEATAFERLIALADLGMLEPGEERGRFRMHDLMRELAELGQTEARFLAPGHRHTAYYLEVLTSCDNLYLEGGAENAITALAHFDRERRNIEAGQAWAAARPERDRQIAEIASRYPNAGRYLLSLRLHSRVRIRWLESAIAGAREIGDRRAEGSHLGSLGRAHAHLGDTNRAIEFFQQALGIARETGNRSGEGNILGNLGLAHTEIGDTGRAIKFYEQALRIAREIGDRREEGVHLGNLGLVHAHLGDTGHAIEFYEQALRITRETGDRRGEANTLGNLGLTHANLGDTLRAIEFHQQALRIARETGDRRGEAIELRNLGLAQAGPGEIRFAIEFHQQALEIWREIGDRRGEATELQNFGFAHADLGEIRLAIEFHEQALEIWREIGDRRLEGYEFANLGVAHADLGEISRAIKFHRKALELLEAIEDPKAEIVRKWLAENSD